MFENLFGRLRRAPTAPNGRYQHGNDQLIELRSVVKTYQSGAGAFTALKSVAAGVNQLRSPDRSMVVVTHYQRLLDYIVPDFVHVLIDGRIAQSGGKDLARELEAKGYAWLEEAPAR